MLTGILITLVVVEGLLTLLAIYVIARLNKYISNLEDSHDETMDRVDNLQKSMNRALKEDLFKDGTLKKPLVSTDDMP